MVSMIVGGAGVGGSAGGTKREEKNGVKKSRNMKEKVLSEKQGQLEERELPNLLFQKRGNKVQTVIQAIPEYDTLQPGEHIETVNSPIQ